MRDCIAGLLANLSVRDFQEIEGRQLITHAAVNAVIILLSIVIDADRGAEPSDLLVPQLRPILGGHQETAASHALVSPHRLHAAPFLVDLRVLLHNLGLLQVCHIN